jgi:hypothetical protein
LAPRSFCAAAAIALVLSGCSGPEPAPPTTAADSPPGRLVDAPVDFSGYPVLQTLVQKSVRVRYRSTSGVDGSGTTVSGVVLVPKGEPPPGGWPVAAIGHPTAGVATSCAPSAYPGLMGSLPAVIPFLTYGYVVAMSDYQGLGTPGPHPYLDPKTAGYNVIDSVRAARDVVPDTSGAWVSYGVSQGGQAVWAANEMAPEYGADLRLLGSISVAPATDLRPLVDSMVAGTLTTAQKVVLPLVLEGVRTLHPELNLDDYLHGVMRSRLDVFLACAGDGEGLKATVAESAPAGDTAPVDATAADRLRNWLGDMALPRQPASAPMLVAYGDADETVLPAWTEASITAACGMGDVVDAQVAQGQGHGMLDLGGLPAAWVTDRLAGLPAPNTCPPPA